jgi:hypothetical protein
MTEVEVSKMNGSFQGRDGKHGRKGFYKNVAFLLGWKAWKERFL